MIYVISDIHGNLRRFRSVMKQIDLQPQDQLYVLGDVIDRHKDGLRILRTIMGMENAHMILGNHEYMMLWALGYPCDDNVDDGGALGHWYRNGGQVTHSHFKHLRKNLRQEIIQYLLHLPLQREVTLNGTCYKLVHAAAAEEFDHDPIYKNATHFAVWKRYDAKDIPQRAYTLVFGHTPTRYYRDIAPMEVWKQTSAIGIDCGCGYPEDRSQPLWNYGRLACVRLDDGKVFYSEECDEKPSA